MTPAYGYRIMEEEEEEEEQLTGWMAGPQDTTKTDGMTD
jgi:hypothetical protein